MHGLMWWSGEQPAGHPRPSELSHRSVFLPLPRNMVRDA